MNNTLLIVVAVAVVAILITLFIAYLQKKGVNVNAVLKEAETGLEEAEVCTKAMIQLSTDKLKTVLVPIEKLEELALIGINDVEDHVTNGDFKDDETGDQKRNAAESFAFNVLKQNNFQITDDVKTIVDSVIRSKYFSNKTIQQLSDKLDKLHDKEITDLKKQNDTLKSQLDTIISQNTSLQADVKNAQSKLTIAQNALNSTSQSVSANNATTQPVQA